MIIPDSVPEHIRTIKNEDISYRSTSYYSTINNRKDGLVIQAPILSIFDKYRHFLEPAIFTKELTEEQYQNYRFKPKTLSNDLYNTTEFWSALLSINQCTSIMEFDLRKVRISDATKMMRLLIEILIIDGIL